jgi:hypothetical protein
MADHLKETIPHGHNNSENYASENRWRHQESSSYASHVHPNKVSRKVRDADERGGIADLTDFLNSSRAEGTRTGAAGTHKAIVVNGYGDGLPRPNTIEGAAENSASLDGPAEEVLARVDIREVRCGPLLNYRGMDGSAWHGSVLIVTRGGISDEYFEPELILKRIGGRVPNRHTSDGASSAEDKIRINDGSSKGLKLCSSIEPWQALTK